MSIFKPRINDITTSIEFPPAFRALARDKPKRNWIYPQKFAARQKVAYPEIKPLVVKRPAAEVFKTTKEFAENKTGWFIVNVDSSVYSIEASAKTKLLKFVDDIVVEVRPINSDKSEVHMRSKSRLGQSDFGANAKRIREFLDALQLEIQKHS